ncbi:diguanylate cyclase domain-containing protein [Bacillus solitudinis]|uniref:diguanylate cyclase domain-containing protein n=1 Tax=Bacillus solitudinis TaxID=2014074 RepID=UPI0012FD5E94
MKKPILTISIGFCSNTSNKSLSINNIIQLADEFLYKAKNMVRDQVVIYNIYNDYV